MVFPVQTPNSLAVSVIIPTYNRVHCVGEAIESVLAQDPPADEVIVVDDGSTDNTADVLAAYGNRITVLHQVNAGAAAARNTGIKHAGSDWVAFLDSDDLWLPGRLAALHSDLEEAEDDVVAHTGDMLLTGPGYSQRLYELRGLNVPRGNAEKVTDALARILPGIFPTVTAMRRDAALGAGGFREGMHVHEDTALFSVLALQGSWMFTGDVLGEVRRLPNDNTALVRLFDDNPVEAYSLIERHLRDLMQQRLTPAQKSLVKRHLSGALINRAAAEYSTGTGNHRQTLVQMARTHPSALKGWLKLIPPFSLGRLGYKFILKRNPFTRAVHQESAQVSE